MSEERIEILISIPQDFENKFLGFINNLNMLNKDGDPPIVVEEIYIKKKFAAVPKKRSRE